MSLPQEFKDAIQPFKDQHVLVIIRKDSRRDHCGYIHKNRTTIENLELSDFDKFNKQPLGWSEVEPFKLNLEEQ